MLEEISGTKVVVLLAVLVANVEYAASVKLALERELISGSTEGLAEFSVVVGTSLEGLSLHMLAKPEERQIRV